MSEKMFTTGRAKAIEQLAKELETGYGAPYVVPVSDTGGAPSVVLSGSIPEYGWVNGDTEPEPDRFAFGVKVDSTTGNITCMYWDGTAWKAVV